MSILPQLAWRAGAVAPISHAGIEGVEVIPYLPNRLVFAHIVAQALESSDYTGVLVDLPSFMQRPGWLNAPLALLPFVSLAVFVAADGSQRAIPFSPCAPAAVAALIARRKQAALRCVEDANTLNHPLAHMFCPEVALREDYRVYEQGLEAFFAPAWKQLDEAWAAADATTHFFAMQRAKGALRRVRSAAPRKRCLLVADFRLWWLLTKAAVEEAPSASYVFQWRVPSRALLLLPEPGESWTHNLLDDYPVVTLQFWERYLHEPGAESAPPRQPGEGNVIQLPVRGARFPAAGRPERTWFHAPFDKREVIEENLAEAVSPPDTPGRRRSSSTTRSILAFVGYLRRLMAIHQRALPQAASQALFAARATGGRTFAHRLRRILLAYPGPDAICPADPNANVPSLGDLVSASTSRRLDDRPSAGADASGESEARREEVQTLLLDADDAAALRALIGSPDGVMRFAIQLEYALHARLCQASQRLARCPSGRGRSRPSFGSLAGGIDWKATLASFATGEEHIYVHDAPQRSRAARGINAWTPTVFLLGSEQEIERSTIRPVMDANPARDAINRGIADFRFQDVLPPDFVYSVIAAVYQCRELHAHHLREETLSAIGFLCASPLMGPARHSLITRRPPRRHCRTDPDFETDFAGMSNSERLIAWAVKYGAGTVIVVAAAGWKPSQRSMRHAREAHAEIIAVPISRLPAQQIERLKRMNLVSRNLRQHPRREEILGCLLE